MEKEHYLTEAIRNLCKGENGYTSGAFVGAMQKMLRDNEWVHIPCREVDGNMSISYVEMSGHVFLVMFSEGKFMKTSPGISIVSTDINKIFDAAEGCDVDGVAINPFTPDCHCAITKDKFAMLRGK